MIKNYLSYLLCERLADLTHVGIVMRFFQNGEFFWVALILAFLAFKRINSHKATKVFRLGRDRHEIHRDTFEQSEYRASLS